MALQEAIAADNVNELYSLIERDESLLHHGSKGPFPNTPLHVAADQGKTKVAMEIAILKPSFARKLNRGGYSPMHLALQKKHFHTVRALMTLNPKLIRVRGRGGITPLHFVAGEKGDNERDNEEFLELLAEFLYACKSSIEDLTSQCETAIHIAVRTGNTEAFKVLFGWLKQVRLTRILDWKDQDGDTALHIAASEKQPEIIKLLIGYTTVKAKNFQGKTAFEIFQVNPSGGPDVAERFRYEGRLAGWFAPTLSPSQFFSREQTTFEMFGNFFKVPDKSTRDIIVVVSTLIASATYQAALSPPGGYWQDDSSNPPANSTAFIANSSDVSIGKYHQAGNIILSGWKLYEYTFWNSMAFFASIATILATALPLGPGTILVYVSLLVLCTAYVISFSIQIPKTDAWAGTTPGLFFDIFKLAVFCLPMYMRIKHMVVQPRIDAIGRRVATF